MKLEHAKTRLTNLLKKRAKLSRVVGSRDELRESSAKFSIESLYSVAGLVAASRSEWRAFHLAA